MRTVFRWVGNLFTRSSAQPTRFFTPATPYHARTMNLPNCLNLWSPLRRCAGALLLLAMAMAWGSGLAMAQTFRQSSASESAAPASQPGRRVALLLGNSAYSRLKRLDNPKNDVRLMEATLRELGFGEIIGGTQNGLDKTLGEMLELLDTFGKRTAGAEVAVVFFAGHGLVTKQGNEQYLAAIEASAIEARLPAEALSINQIMAKLSQSGAEKNFVFLDACRESARGGGMRSVVPSRDAPNTVILYATAADDLAADGIGANSPFTTALASEIKVPNQEWAEVQRRVVRRVKQSTQEKQEPKAYGSLSETMYFKMQVESGPSKLEETYWKSIENSNDAADFQAYLKDYPQGAFRSLAQNKLRRLASVPAPVPVAVPASVAVSTPVATPVTAPAPQAGSTFKDCADCPEMVVIPAGSFTMGSNAAEQALANTAGVGKNFTDRENPQHSVSVRSFAAGRYAVTKGQFAAFAKAKAYQTEAEKDDGCFAWTGTEWKKDKAYNWRSPGFNQADDHPVACVSWNDAQAYAQWLSQTTGKAYRLPSEAEREYAARAGSQTAFWWGNSINTNQANYNGNYAYNGSEKGLYRQTTVAVNSFAANPFGLYNMHGNVLEWTQDCWNETYQGAPTDGSAWATGDCSQRVLRGGSWGNIPAILRSAIRHGDAAVGRFTITGFRLARTLP
jgi:formylglycine-generating enzyme required for sulfatase activity